MKFKTQSGQEAYNKLVEEASSSAAELYKKANLSSSRQDMIMASVAIEEFRHNCMARAIHVANEVDAEWARVKSGVVLARAQLDEMG